MAMLRMVAAAIRRDDYVVSLDLSDAYFHVQIFPQFRGFMRFKFRGKIFKFRVMPFGLSLASRLSTKLIRAITTFCHKRGIRLIFYLDDTIIMGHSHAQVLAHRDFVMDLLRKLGFMINIEKSDLAPVKQFMFLRLLWDSSSHSVTLAEDKKVTLRSSAQHLLDKT